MLKIKGTRLWFVFEKERNGPVLECSTGEGRGSGDVLKRRGMRLCCGVEEERNEAMVII